MPRKQAKIERDTPSRVERLGFRLDKETKDLIERGAYLSRRKVSDFCVTALTETARRTIAEHETLELSDRDRQAFFEALTNPPKPSERLGPRSGRAQGARGVIGMAPPRPELRVEALAAHHDRDAFRAASTASTAIYGSKPGQDVRRRANGVFILVAAKRRRTQYLAITRSAPHLCRRATFRRRRVSIFPAIRW